MTTTQTSSTTENKKSARKKQSFPSASINIGTPKVPLRKPHKTTQQYELLSDWEHAS